MGKQNEPYDHSIDDILYGCECDCKNAHGPEGPDKAPVAYLIERKGKQLKVCTRCNLSSDRILALLISEMIDPKPYLDFDVMGFMGYVAKYTEAMKTESKTKH